MPRRKRPRPKPAPEPPAENERRINPNDPFVKGAFFLLGLLSPILVLLIIAGVYRLFG